MRRAAIVLCAAVLACNARRRPSVGADGAASPAIPEAPPGPLVEVAAVRANEGSQPRWHHLARAQRPRGQERWRYDLTPREASGEPATDGRTVFVAAARPTPDGPSEGEVFAFDLRDGSLRWHTPVGGIHGEPVELADDLVLVDTIAHCADRMDEPTGAGVRTCRDARPGGLVALDVATGRQRFRTDGASVALRSRWSVIESGGTRWMHAGAAGLRAVQLPSGTLGGRINTVGPVLQGVGVTGGDVVTLVDARRTTLVARRAANVARPRWERAVPWRGGCAPIVAGPLLVIPGFSSNGLAGAPRALNLGDGADRWTAPTPPTEVQTCAAAENAVVWQVRDGALRGNTLVDGRERGGHRLPAAPTGDLAVLLDGVFYVSQPRSLLGVDVNSGAPAVELRTEADVVEGLVLWGGRGVAVTRRPGLVLGFD